jgi:predicted nucleotidyltransferase component of viral defense system
MSWNARQVVETFHLVFLRALVAKGDDKALIALKGGCNLRFYFGSVRYSEDIDFDVSVIAKDTLKNKVERLFRSPLITAPLKTKGIEIGQITAPKQTETTQRWKLGLKVASISVPLRTKVEFSRRDAIGETAFARVDPEVLRPYGLPAFLASHYTTAAAITQKIHALAARTEPQARDLFDLQLLLARPEVAKLTLSAAQQAWLPNAIEHAIALSFDEYQAKVIAYLEPAHVELYSARAAWDTMQDAVVAQLEALR